MKGRLGRRREQVLHELKEKREYLKLEEEALDGSVWRTGFKRDCGPVIRQTAVCSSCDVHQPLVGLVVHFCSILRILMTDLRQID